jgi:hypothetical protein
MMMMVTMVTIIKWGLVTMNRDTEEPTLLRSTWWYFTQGFVAKNELMAYKREGMCYVTESA